MESGSRRSLRFPMHIRNWRIFRRVIRSPRGAVLGVSVAAMVISLAGLVLQILDGLNIKLF